MEESRSEPDHPGQVGLGLGPSTLETVATVNQEHETGLAIKQSDCDNTGVIGINQLK